MNLLDEVKGVLRTCTDHRKAELLRLCSDDLREAHELFAVTCSRETMRNLVGAWSRVLLVLDSVKPIADSKPLTSKP